MNTKINKVIKLPNKKTIDVEEFVKTFDHVLAIGNGYAECTYNNYEVELLDLEYDRLGIVLVVYKYLQDEHTIRTIKRHGAGYEVHMNRVDN